MESLSINTNTMAINAWRNLQSSSSRLSASVRRMSSGLRVSTASDDAAGLAIRELMRADVAGLHQGVRNANDAISMIQTADGALSVIDEKLIRMKELAEQAATGTYDSTQRLIIDYEFQAMAAEIDRIANATDFNGVKLLDGSRSGTHDGSGLDASGVVKVHFGTANDSAEDYYYVNGGDATAAGLGLGTRIITNTVGPGGGGPGTVTVGGDTVSVNDYNGEMPWSVVMPNTMSTMENAVPRGDEWFLANHLSSGLRFMFIIPAGSKNVVINTAGGNTNFEGGGTDNDIQLFTRDGTHLAGTPLDDIVYGMKNAPGWGGPEHNTIDDYSHVLGFNQADYKGGHLNQGPGTFDTTGVSLNHSTYNGMTIGYSGDSERHDAIPNDGIRQANGMDYEVLTIDETTEDLIFWLPGSESAFFKAHWDGAPPPDPHSQAPGLVETNNRGVSLSIRTQDQAQSGLTKIDQAIVTKDKIRANLGATQNRLENTITTLNIQAENLQAAESRISDVDVAQEMTSFVRSQILTEASTAILAQANSFPKNLLNLLP